MLLRILSEAIATSYLDVVLETSVSPKSSHQPTDISSSAFTRIDGADTKSGPNLNALGIIRFVDLICHLWQQYINTALLPLASSSVTTRREMVLFNNQTVSRLELGANNVLQKVTDCVFSSSNSHHTPNLPQQLLTGFLFNS